MAWIRRLGKLLFLGVRTAQRELDCFSFILYVCQCIYLYTHFYSFLPQGFFSSAKLPSGSLQLFRPPAGKESPDTYQSCSKKMSGAQQALMLSKVLSANTSWYRHQSIARKYESVGLDALGSSLLWVARHAKEAITTSSFATAFGSALSAEGERHQGSSSTLRHEAKQLQLFRRPHKIWVSFAWAEKMWSATSTPEKTGLAGDSEWEWDTPKMKVSNRMEQVCVWDKQHLAVSGFSGVQCFQWAIFERLKVLWGHFQVSKSLLKMKIQKTTQDLRTLCFLTFV